MSFGADWTCSCGWANLDVRPKCRNCGAANPDYSPVTRKPASSPAGGDVREEAARICEEARPVRGHVIEFDGMQFVKIDDVNSELNKRAAEIRALSPSTSAAEPVEKVIDYYTANCCHCGRIVDTREEKEGGDKFGCEMSDGRWTCSPECWDAVVEPGAAHPAPAAVESAQGVKR